MPDDENTNSSDGFPHSTGTPTNYESTSHDSRTKNEDSSKSESQPTKLREKEIVTGLTLTTALLYTGIFLLFTGVFLVLVTSFTCVNNIVAEAMTFSSGIPSDGPVSDYLQQQFESCMVVEVFTVRTLLLSTLSAGVVTLTIYTWYNLEMSFKDWLGF